MKWKKIIGMASRSSPRIVIIGAGVAGIAAATSLLDRGFDDVKIIEAENRLGGRVYTVPFGSKHVDIGAHWVHGAVDNVVYGMACKMDMIYESGDFNKIYFITDDGRTLPSDVGMSLFASFGSIVQDEEQLKDAKGSLEDFLIPKYKELASKMIDDEQLVEAFIDWACKFECTVEGCDELGDVSAAGMNHYKQCDGDPAMCWRSGGYYNIVDILLRIHPKCVGESISLTDRIVMNTEVQEIDWNGLTALVKCSNGELYKADHVIVTVSLGVLKERYRTLFNPQLPIEKVRAILGLGFGTVDKMYLKFPTRWWPEDRSGFSLLRTKNTDDTPTQDVVFPWERKVLGFYMESAADPTVVCAWLVGNAARDMETCSDEEVLLACHRILSSFLSDKYDIPKPEQIVRSKWHGNSHFRGSYSFRSNATEALNTSADILSQPLQNNYNKMMLLFAGEATHSHYYSTVHGALESGWREAKRVAELYLSEKDR